MHINLAENGTALNLASLQILLQRECDCYRILKVREAAVEARREEPSIGLALLATRGFSSITCASIIPGED